MFIGSQFTKIALHCECLLRFLENSQISTLDHESIPPLVNMSPRETTQFNDEEVLQKVTLTEFT